MTIKNFIAGGCSFTYGSELSDDDKGKTPSKMSWAHQLMLRSPATTNDNYVCVAKPGTGNTGIARRVFDAVANTDNIRCVELYFKACENGKLGITQTLGPGYKITSKVNWLVGKLAIIKSQNFKHAVKSKIGYDKARKLAFAPHINIGVFSLEKNSKGWISWQNNLSKTLKAGNIFGSEGLAINMSVYIDNLETEFLP